MRKQAGKLRNEVSQLAIYYTITSEMPQSPIFQTLLLIIDLVG